MALPLIPIAIAGASGLAGGLLGGMFGGGKQDQEAETTDNTYIDIYSPTTTDARQDSRQMVYSPIIQIESPQATATQRQDLYTEQTQRIAQDPNISPQVERVLVQETGTGGGISNQALLIGGLVVGAIILIPNLIK